MNTRRKFILQSGMAATALLATKPFSAIAGSNSLLNGSFSANNITFLHTTSSAYNVADKVRKIKNRNSNVLLLHPGNESHEGYDISVVSLTEKADSYKIIYKGNIKVGVITATKENSINEVNNLSSFLKNEKNCQLVVCLSQLGYKNKNQADDIQLASKSENVDIIIGKHSATSPKHPIIARNKNEAEVIIHHAENNEAALSAIRIGFDNSGNKNNISFS